MEEWLSDPVRMSWEQERESRRASNANSRAASRMHTPRPGCVGIPQLCSSSHTVVVENASRFPLSSSALKLLTEPYFRNLGRGETTFTSIDQDCRFEVITQQVTTDVADEEIGFFLLGEESSNVADQDRTFMYNVSRSLTMTKQLQRHDQSTIEGPVLSASKLESHPQCDPASTFSTRTHTTDSTFTSLHHHSSSTTATKIPFASVNPSFHHNLNTTTTQVPFASVNSPNRVPMGVPLVSNKTEKSKAPSKKFPWSSRSHAIANDNDPIATYHEAVMSDDGNHSTKSHGPNSKKSPPQSVIREFARALGRMFVKSDAQ